MLPWTTVPDKADGYVKIQVGYPPSTKVGTLFQLFEWANLQLPDMNESFFFCATFPAHNFILDVPFYGGDKWQYSIHGESCYKWTNKKNTRTLVCV